MAVTDFTAYLAPQDKEKLARNIGIPIGDGRVFKRGVIVSAQDTATSLADQARNQAFSAQTGQFADRTGTVNPNQAAQRAYTGYMQGSGIAPQPSQAFMPQGATQGAAAQPMQPAPMQMMLAQAQQIQRYQSANPQSLAPAPAQPPLGIATAAGPNISTNTGLPQGSIGYQNAQGQFVVQSQVGQGMGTQTFANEGAAKNALAGAPSYGAAPTGPVNAPSVPAGAPSPTFLPQSAPQPSLADKTYSPQEIARMTPEQLMARTAFDQQNAANAAAQAKEKAAAGYGTQQEALAAGNAAKQEGQAVQVEPTGKGGFTFKIVQEQKPAQTNVSLDKGANKAEEVIGEAAGNQYQAWQEQADAAQKSKRLYEDVSKLYKEGGYSGPGADAVSFFKGLAASAGVDVAGAATQDQLAAKLATASLERTRALYKGMGALSNLEGQKAEKTFAALSKTPAGNLAILKYEAANAPILEQALELRDQLRDKYQGDPRSVEKINKEVRSFVQKNYRKLEDVAASELADANKADSPKSSPAKDTNTLNLPKGWTISK